jgi:RND family efflux transporter MFP subunit
MVTPDAEDIATLEIPKQQRARGGRGWPWPLILLIVVLAAAALFHKQLLAALASWQAPRLAVAEVQRVSAAALMAEEGTSSNGYVVAARRAALSADTPGRIVELNVTEGSQVERGQVVARLFHDELEALVDVAKAQVESAKAAVLQAEAQLAATEAELPSLASDEAAALASISAARARETLARLELERISPLVKDLILPTRDQDRAQAELDSAGADRLAAEARRESAAANRVAAAARVEVARAAVALAQAGVPNAEAALAAAAARLDNTFVRAPFDGIVVLKDAEVGEVVSPNVVGGSTSRGSVATMVDRASLEVQAEVPETSLAAVAVGRPARLFLDAFPDEPYDGQVDRIWPTANREKATVEVRVRFLSPDDRLRPEMGVRVVFLPPGRELEASRASAGPLLMLPKAALVERGGKRGAMRLEDGRARFVVLELGPEQAGRLEIKSGLEPGDQVLLDVPAELADGARVSIRAS